MQVICDAAPKTPDPRVNFQINWKPISSRVQLIYSRSEQAGIFPLFSKHAPGDNVSGCRKGKKDNGKIPLSYLSSAQDSF